MRLRHGRTGYRLMLRAADGASYRLMLRAADGADYRFMLRAASGASRQLLLRQRCDCQLVRLRHEFGPLHR